MQQLLTKDGPAQARRKSGSATLPEGRDCTAVRTLLGPSATLHIVLLAEGEAEGRNHGLLGMAPGSQGEASRIGVLIFGSYIGPTSLTPV